MAEALYKQNAGNGGPGTGNGEPGAGNGRDDSADAVKDGEVVDAEFAETR